MGSFAKIKFGLLGVLLAGVGAFFVSSARQAKAAPTTPCAVCLCHNVFAYQAFGAAPAGPISYYRKDAGGKYVQSTQAFSSLQTNETCDTKNTRPVKTTEQVYQGTPGGDTACAYNNPPPGQTIYVHFKYTVSAQPKEDAKGVDRYVCAP